jgi:hypothetical protein
MNTEKYLEEILPNSISLLSATPGSFSVLDEHHQFISIVSSVLLLLNTDITFDIFKHVSGDVTRLL